MRRAEGQAGSLGAGGTEDSGTGNSGTQDSGTQDSGTQDSGTEDSGAEEGRGQAREPARRSRWAARLLAAAAVGALVLAGFNDTSASAGTASRKGTAFNGTSAVGALFTSSDGHLGRHFCTASVVDSPQQDLLITAAHCMDGRSLLPAGSIEFAPGYHSGKFPHGLWQVTTKFVNTLWSTSHDPNNDVAFLVAGRTGTHIERHTGAERLMAYQKLPRMVQVIGYPDGANRPITCKAITHSYDPGTLRQIVFDCGGYTDGTSGGPFILDASAKTGEGLVIGVIGGFQMGGISPNVSYSSKFLANVQALYKVATTPPPPPSG